MEAAAGSDRKSNARPFGSSARVTSGGTKIANSASIADTEHPAAALFYLARMRQKQGIYVMLDLAGHLKDDRTLRLLKDAIASMIGTSSVLVLIDHQVRALARTELAANQVRHSVSERLELAQAE